MSDRIKHISKLMSLVLRHNPAEIGLQLNENGWASVQELINKINSKGVYIDLALLNEVVETSDKRRFAFNEDKTMIRASQGHSIKVELELSVHIPPDILYHGTASRFLESILAKGLDKQSRQHVHLSATIETAKSVGSRHGKPVILTVNAKAMQKAGLKFYLSANNVWLTDAVPVQYISQ